MNAFEMATNLTTTTITATATATKTTTSSIEKASLKTATTIASVKTTNQFAIGYSNGILYHLQDDEFNDDIENDDDDDDDDNEYEDVDVDVDAIENVDEENEYRKNGKSKTNNKTTTKCNSKFPSGNDSNNNNNSKMCLNSSRSIYESDGITKKQQHAIYESNGDKNSPLGHSNDEGDTGVDAGVEDEDDEDDGNDVDKNDKNNDDEIDNFYRLGIDGKLFSASLADDSVILGDQDDMCFDDNDNDDSSSATSMETSSDSVAIWLDGEKHWISGVDSNTSCWDLICALLLFQRKELFVQQLQEYRRQINENKTHDDRMEECRRQQSLININNSNDNNNNDSDILSKQQYSRSMEGQKASVTTTAEINAPTAVMMDTFGVGMQNNKNTKDTKENLGYNADNKDIMSTNIGSHDNVDNHGPSHRHLNKCKTLNDIHFPTNTSSRPPPANCKASPAHSSQAQSELPLSSTSPLPAPAPPPPLPCESQPAMTTMTAINPALVALASEYVIVRQHRNWQEYLDSSTKVFDVLPARPNIVSYVNNSNNNNNKNSDNSKKNKNNIGNTVNAFEWAKSRPFGEQCQPPRSRNSKQNIISMTTTGKECKLLLRRLVPAAANATVLASSSSVLLTTNNGSNVRASGISNNQNVSGKQSRLRQQHCLEHGAQVSSLLSTDKDSGMGSPAGSTTRSARFRRRKYKSATWLAQGNTLHPKLSQRVTDFDRGLPSARTSASSSAKTSNVPGTTAAITIATATQNTADFGGTMAAVANGIMTCASGNPRNTNTNADEGKNAICNAIGSIAGNGIDADLANERLVKIILAQDETIHRQLTMLREKEHQIMTIEEEKHRVRERELGKNYLLETYLNGLDEANFESVNEYPEGEEIFIDEPYDVEYFASAAAAAAAAKQSQVEPRKMSKQKSSKHQQQSHQRQKDQQQQNNQIQSHSKCHPNDTLSGDRHAHDNGKSKGKSSKDDENNKKTKSKQKTPNGASSKSSNKKTHKYNSKNKKNENIDNERNLMLKIKPIDEANLLHINDDNAAFADVAQKAIGKSEVADVTTANGISSLKGKKQKEIELQILWWEKVHTLNKQLQREEETLLKLYAKIRKYQARYAHKFQNDVMQQIDEMDAKLALQCADICRAEDKLLIYNEELKTKLKFLERLQQIESDIEIMEANKIDKHIAAIAEGSKSLRNEDGDGSVSAKDNEANDLIICAAANASNTFSNDSIDLMDDKQQQQQQQKQSSSTEAKGENGKIIDSHTYPIDKDESVPRSMLTDDFHQNKVNSKANNTMKPLESLKENDQTIAPANQHLIAVEVHKSNEFETSEEYETRPVVKEKASTNGINFRPSGILKFINRLSGKTHDSAANSLNSTKGTKATKGNVNINHTNQTENTCLSLRPTTPGIIAATNLPVDPQLDETQNLVQQPNAQQERECIYRLQSTCVPEPLPSQSQRLLQLQQKQQQQHFQNQQQEYYEQQQYSHQQQLQQYYRQQRRYHQPQQYPQQQQQQLQQQQYQERCHQQKYNQQQQQQHSLPQLSHNSQRYYEQQQQQQHYAGSEDRIIGNNSKTAYFQANALREGIHHKTPVPHVQALPTSTATIPLATENTTLYVGNDKNVLSNHYINPMKSVNKQLFDLQACNRPSPPTSTHNVNHGTQNLNQQGHSQLTILYQQQQQQQHQQQQHSQHPKEFSIKACMPLAGALGPVNPFNINNNNNISCFAIQKQRPTMSPTPIVTGFNPKTVIPTIPTPATTGTATAAATKAMHLTASPVTITNNLDNSVALPSSSLDTVMTSNVDSSRLGTLV